MKKKIETFNTHQFLGKFMNPDPKVSQIIKRNDGRFFVIKVQDMIKVSKLPVPPSRATTHTLIFLTGGVASMKIGFHKVSIKKYECLVVPAGQVFSYDKHDVNSGFLCSFDNDFLVGKIGNKELLKQLDFLNVWANPIIKPKVKTAKYLQQTFQRVLDEYVQSGASNNQIIQAHLIAALCELNVSYQPLFKSKNKTAVTLVNRFKELLHQHIKSKHLVTDYAKLLHVSPNHLNKKVKEVTAKSVSKWIAEAIVTEAKVLLCQTNNSVAEIAADLGIADASYFSRLFKKYEKQTPLAFRRMIEMS